ncbi:MAG: alpha-amylase family glycosyl hydrolase [Bacteroidia bacterium]|nr:alpha-amylase family glycosyl hydrolase [Bacteroidia bacterium]
MKKIKLSRGIFYLLLIVNSLVNAQVVSLSPVFPTQSQNVTVTFDASKGNGALVGQSIVYAHTGVITNLSNSPNDWRYVQGNWGTDDSRVRMTSLGSNKFQLSFNISTFYGVPSTESVKSLAFVFRNGNGSIVGRNTDGSDIFVSISDGSFRYNIISTPFGNPQILFLNDTLKYLIQSSDVSNISLNINGVNLITKESVQTVDTFLTGAQLGLGKHWIKAVLFHKGNTYVDSALVVVRGVSSTFVGESPAGILDGINYLNDSTVLLQFLAPQKNFVYLIGDFNNWEIDPNYEMKRTPDGIRYWIQITGLVPGKEYAFQYSIDKQQLRVADPFADKFLDGDNDRFIDAETYPDLKSYPQGKTTNYVSVFQTAQKPYNWIISDFKKPASNNLVIYELLIRDFVGKHNYQALIDTISYLKRLGINAIGLMPFNEFEGNESWGYNTAFYFAPDKYYGTKDKLKEFIDVCHQNGIAVIMDMVLNHSFGQSSMVRMYFNTSTGKPQNNPWFNEDAKHPFNVGYDFNHESIYTQNFVDTVVKYWIKEYKIDGYRFDLSKGFTQRNTPTDVSAWSSYDQSRINLWKRISDRLRPNCQDCYLILEHFADNSEEKVLSDYGFMFWGNINHAFNEATMGYTSDLRPALWQHRGWSEPNLIRYAESHDEERLMYKNLNFGFTSPNYSIRDTFTALERCEAAAVILAAMPGPYMIWQFGELGYPYSINTCKDGTVNNNCRLDNKPIRWDYLKETPRKRIYEVFAAMNSLKSKYQVFATGAITHNLTSAVKTMLLNDSSLNVFVAANFGTSILPLIRKVNHTGWWYNYFDGDSVYFNNTSDTVQLKPGKYVLFTDKKLERPNLEISTVIGETEEITELAIFPNPTAGLINIKSGYTVTGYEVSDIMGRKLVKGDSIVDGEIWIGTLTPGTYYLSISSAKGIVTKKIILYN